LFLLNIVAVLLSFMWPFRKSKTVAAPSAKAPSLEEISYAVAYFVLPHYAFNNLNKVVEMWAKTPSAAGPFFYLMACQLRMIEPDVNRASEFRARHGDLPGIGHYFLLEHPKPAAIDLSDRDPLEVVNNPGLFVLAPYFSLIIQPAESTEVMYYVLGQTPIGGGTTLRCLTKDGINANLGPGPSPTVESFLEAVRTIRAPK
jgi:hypothetical protein